MSFIASKNCFVRIRNTISKKQLLSQNQTKKITLSYFVNATDSFNLNQLKFSWIILLYMVYLWS